MRPIATNSVYLFVLSMSYYVSPPEAMPGIIPAVLPGDRASTAPGKTRSLAGIGGLAPKIMRLSRVICESWQPART